MEHYNNIRLNSATSYITPKDVLAGREQKTRAERTGGWKPPDSSAGVAASKTPEARSWPARDVGQAVKRIVSSLLLVSLSKMLRSNVPDSRKLLGPRYFRSHLRDDQFR